MRIAVADNYDDLSRDAAQRVAELLRDLPGAAVVVATGETPMGMYRELAALKQHGLFDTSRLRIFQLDEYFGVGDDDERSLYGWMKRSFLDPLGIRADQVVRLRGEPTFSRLRTDGERAFSYCFPAALSHCRTRRKRSP